MFDIAGPVLFVVAVSLVAIGVPFVALTYVHRGDPVYEDWLRRGLLLIGAGLAARTLMDVVVEPCAEFVDQRLERLERLAHRRGVPVSSSTSRRTGSSTVGAVIDGGFTDMNAALEALAGIGCRQPQETAGVGRVS